MLATRKKMHAYYKRLIFSSHIVLALFLYKVKNMMKKLDNATVLRLTSTETLCSAGNVSLNVSAL